MGRPQQTRPPVPVEIVTESFGLRQDGAIIRRDCHVDALTGEPATFRGPHNRLMVRIYVDGEVRRLLATRIAWALATGSWPSGVVKARNGIDDDLRPENLILTKHGRDPFGAISPKHAKGGKASALHERDKKTVTLLRTLAQHEGSTVPELSELVGSSVSCCCTRLGKLADAGLTCGPKCDARARWDLTARGRELAAAPEPVILDDLEEAILSALARASAGLVSISRQTGACQLTVKRRAERLIRRDLAFRDPRGFYVVTEAGRAALGDTAPSQHEPWVKATAVSAAAARDVRDRQTHHAFDDRNAAQRSAQGTMAAAKSAETMRMNKTSFNRFRELDSLDHLDRMAG